MCFDDDAKLIICAEILLKRQTLIDYVDDGPLLSPRHARLYTYCAALLRVLNKTYNYEKLTSIVFPVNILVMDVKILY